MASLTICPRLWMACGWLLLLPLVARAGEPDWSLVEGTIDGAPYQLALPAKMSGNLLIHAHGSRPAESPLSIELELEQTAHGQLLANGWIIAASAFRRNGIIVADAMIDMVNLRDHIEKAHGPLAMVLVEGQSMGGAIVTHLAESRPDRFHGAVALGAALQVRDPMASLELSHQPKIPILFLSNRSEIEGPRTYAAKAAEGPVPPVVWSVDRDGHVNINQAERLLALEALINWIASDRIPTERDVTVEIELDQTATLEAGQATGRVIEITHNHGNVFIDFRPGDFEHIGIETGDRFNLTVGQVTVEVHYGTTFSDVPVGEWIAFPTAEGDTIVAINFGNAFEQLNPSIGDPATIRPIADSRRAGGSRQ